MKAKTFIYSVAAGVVTLIIWELVKPKIQQVIGSEEQPATENDEGFDWWPFD